jgi:hypothetical protein
MPHGLVLNYGITFNIIKLSATSDILIQAGLALDANGIQHVHFEGLDKDFEKNYGASIPIEKVPIAPILADFTRL